MKKLTFPRVHLFDLRHTVVIIFRELCHVSVQTHRVVVLTLVNFAANLLCLLQILRPVNF